MKVWHELFHPRRSDVEHAAVWPRQSNPLTAATSCPSDNL